MDSVPPSANFWQRIIAVGPAVIVASVVLGPGSILSNSKAGWQYGYDMLWVLVAACVLMAGMISLAARLGVILTHTPCQELRIRMGRWAAALVGTSLFLVATGFQFSNNLGVLFALEPMMERWNWSGIWVHWPVVVLVLLNGLVITALLAFRELYRPIERMMKYLVGLMLIGFAVNLLLAKPSVASVLNGLRPQLASSSNDSSATDTFVILGLVATTFSVGGAFYQAYLVRQKGWTTKNLGQGLWDSLFGTAVLGTMSAMIMITAAAVLHDSPQVTSLDSAADVARQLEPFFGVWASSLFCLGILAGALSSFLGNAAIGGTLLSDGWGWGADINQRMPRVATVGSLLLGMVVAIAVKQYGFNTGRLIIFAQAMTVLGNPLMAAALIWLALQPDVRKQRLIPTWTIVLALLGLLVVIGLSVRTSHGLWQKWRPPQSSCHWFESQHSPLWNRSR
ncbi:MAG: divalent metal cation transporter [Planctomycetales bacterium]|nr:divalent metal cation transporter [Planctomycetales bacterium]